MDRRVTGTPVGPRAARPAYYYLRVTAFVVAAAAGAALLSEPLHRPEPLEPGVHYLEAPSTQMAQSVADLLADEPRRLRIVEAAQSLLASDLHMRNVLPRLVAVGMGS